jgi:hypothetical protein
MKKWQIGLIVVIVLIVIALIVVYFRAIKLGAGDGCFSDSDCEAQSCNQRDWVCMKEGVGLICPALFNGNVDPLPAPDCACESFKCVEVANE